MIYFGPGLDNNPSSSSSKTTITTPPVNAYDDYDYEGSLGNWAFDVWSIPNDSILYGMITMMFNSVGILQDFKISEVDIQNLLIDTRKLYSDGNPYHNFRHAFDVTHMAYLLLTIAKGSEFLTSIEKMALMLCGLLHDVAHPGVNNNYEINTGSKLALRYNDQSVLENFHCATAFRLLQKHNILKNLSRKDYMRIRKLIIDMILATDLSKHIKSLNDFKEFLGKNQDVIQRDNEEHRALVSKMLLICADLCNPAKPFNIARNWAEKIQEEFFLQGDKESSQNLPVSPFMERGNSSLPQMQVNFATVIVIPLYEVMGRILPILQTAVLPVLLENRECWKKLIK